MGWDGMDGMMGWMVWLRGLRDRKSALNTPKSGFKLSVADRIELKREQFLHNEK